jgi:hypothetical protein
MNIDRASSRRGAIKSWENTTDRTARTDPARSKSPSSIDYWIARLPKAERSAPMPERIAAAEAAKSAYYTELAMKSAATRQRNSTGRRVDSAHVTIAVRIPIALAEAIDRAAESAGSTRTLTVRKTLNDAFAA